MKSAPLQLDYSFPRKVFIETTVGEKEITTDFASNCHLEFGQNKDNPRQWQVMLRVDFGGKDNLIATYKGNVEYVGFFTVSDEFPEDSMNRLVTINGPSMLYGAIRELLHLLTGRGPHSPLILPTISFIDGDLNTTNTKEEIGIQSIDDKV